MKSLIMRSGKYEPIRELCESKQVLDIGCVGDYTNIEDIRDNLFVRLNKHAEVFGVDINEEGVKFLSKAGFKCELLNAAQIEELSHPPFDVILLGDIIEHMPDPGHFLVKLRRFLKPGGFIICSTPNVMNYLNTVSMLFHREVTRRQHTMWFCAVTLKNVFRFAGYELDKLYFLNYWDSLVMKGGVRRLRIYLEKIIFSINPELAPTLLGVFRMNPHFNSKYTNAVYEERWHP